MNLCYFLRKIIIKRLTKISLTATFLDSVEIDINSY